MSKIQGETNLVERPFCAQLRAMGWQWIEGDLSVIAMPSRRDVCLRPFQQVCLKDYPKTDTVNKTPVIASMFRVGSSLRDRALPPPEQRPRPAPTTV